MKQMKFLDNVRTPEDWQRRALKMAEAEGRKPKLKKWQSAGIIAVTAMLVLSIGVVPTLSLKKSVNSGIGSEESSSYSSNVTDKEDDVLPVMDGIKDVDGTESLKKIYDYVEIFTVLDSQMMDDGSLWVAGAREKYKMGNGMLCVKVSKEKLSDGDTKAEAPVFGNRVCVAFKKVRGEGLIEIPYDLNINDREYTARQATATITACADYYKPLGETSDTLFKSVLHSAQIAAGVSEDTVNDRVKCYVRETYSNIMNLKPEVSGEINLNGGDAGLNVSMMTTLFEDGFILADGVSSQLYVMKIEKNDGGYLPVDCYYDKQTGENVLRINDMPATVRTDRETDIDILDVRLLNDAENENAVYLLVNAVDKERTGNIRGQLKISVDLDDTKIQEESDGQMHGYSKTQKFSVTNNGFDLKVESDGNVEFITFEDGKNRSTTFLYRFVLTKPDGVDIGKLDNANFYELSKVPEMALLVIGENEYALKAEGDDVKSLSITDVKTYRRKMIVTLGVVYEGIHNAPPEKMTFSFGKMSEYKISFDSREDTTDITWQCKAVFEEDKEKSSDVTGR